MARTIMRILSVILLSILIFSIKTNAMKVHKNFPLKLFEISDQTVFIGRFGISLSGASIVVKYA